VVPGVTSNYVSPSPQIEDSQPPPLSCCADEGLADYVRARSVRTDLLPKEAFKEPFFSPSPTFSLGHADGVAVPGFNLSGAYPVQAFPFLTLMPSPLCLALVLSLSLMTI